MIATSDMMCVLQIATHSGNGSASTPVAGACGAGGLLPLALVPGLLLLMRGRRGA